MTYFSKPDFFLLLCKSLKMSDTFLAKENQYVNFFFWKKKILKKLPNNNCHICHSYIILFGQNCSIQVIISKNKKMILLNCLEKNNSTYFLALNIILTKYTFAKNIWLDYFLQNIWGEDSGWQIAKKKKGKKFFSDHYLSDYC